MNIEYFYNKRCEQKSDINEHLPTLYDLAKECKTIAEFGVRTVVSSFAFAHARPEKLICVDIEKHQNIDPFLEICKKENINVEFHLCDSRKFIMESVDLIFIDTLHTYTQLKEELEVLGNKAKKYLVFHDTITFGNTNEHNMDTGEKKGLVPAISEFLKQNKNWKELKTYSNNNGLTILINETSSN